MSHKQPTVGFICICGHDGRLTSPDCPLHGSQSIRKRIAAQTKDTSVQTRAAISPERLARFLHFNLAAAQNLPYEDGDTCPDCVKAVHIELQAIINEQHVINRAATANATPELHLSGKSTDHIWLMEDGAEPHVIGVRMDCGDSGTVYLTRKQAESLRYQLGILVAPELRKPSVEAEGQYPPHTPECSYWEQNVCNCIHDSSSGDIPANPAPDAEVGEAVERMRKCASGHMRCTVRSTDINLLISDRDRLAGELAEAQAFDPTYFAIVKERDALKAAQQQAVESMQERAALVAENYASRVLVHMKSEEREAIKSFFNGMVSVAEEIRALKPNQTPPSTEREI